MGDCLMVVNRCDLKVSKQPGAWFRNRDDAMGCAQRPPRSCPRRGRSTASCRSWSMLPAHRSAFLRATRAARPTPGRIAMKIKRIIAVAGALTALTITGVRVHGARRSAQPLGAKPAVLVPRQRTRLVGQRVWRLLRGQNLPRRHATERVPPRVLLAADPVHNPRRFEDPAACPSRWLRRPARLSPTC